MWARSYTPPLALRWSCVKTAVACVCTRVINSLCPYNDLRHVDLYLQFIVNCSKFVLHSLNFPLCQRN